MEKFVLPGGFVFDRAVDAVGRNSKGELLYNLTNISEMSLEFTSESKDATDATGALVKRFFTAKTGTISITNAFMSLAAYTASTGTDARVGTAEKKIVAPKIMHAAKGTTSVTIPNVVEGTLHVEGISSSGGKVEAYTLGTEASATAFKYDESDGTVTLPTGVAEEVSTFLITCEREEEAATAIENFSNQFPKPHQLTIRILGSEPCTPDITRAIYVVVDNFQPSPDTTLGFQTDSTHDFTGDLMTAYCGDQKRLVTIYYVDEEETDM